MRSAIFIGVLFAVVCCSQPLITRERAVELATAQAPANATFEGAALVRLAQFAQTQSIRNRALDDPVWAVLFRTTIAPPCPGPPPGTEPPPCPDVLTTMTIVLDARTGELLFRLDSGS
jgi:hypothetical protein